MYNVAARLLLISPLGSPVSINHCNRETCKNRSIGTLGIKLTLPAFSWILNHLLAWLTVTMKSFKCFYFCNKKKYIKLFSFCSQIFCILVTNYFSSENLLFIFLSISSTKFEILLIFQLIIILKRKESLDKTI